MKIASIIALMFSLASLGLITLGAGAVYAGKQDYRREVAWTPSAERGCEILTGAGAIYLEECRTP